MLSTALYDSLNIAENKHFDSVFGSFDAYYEPYFILIQHQESNDFVESLCSSWIRKNEDDLYGCDWFDVSENLMFVSISCHAAEIKTFTAKIINDIESTTHIAVFKHNCLGEPATTFKWSAQLLEETIQNSASKSAIEINDFSDRENWPGLKDYRE